jgi:sugar/nucleoside kinase (ribokinase family)
MPGSSSTAAPLRLGHIAVVGPHLVDVLGRPVIDIPPGQGSLALEEIRITVAGTGGGAAVDLSKLGWRVTSHGAIGTDAAGVLLTSILEDFGVDVTGLVRRVDQPTAVTMLPIRPNGERPALHAAGAVPSLQPSDINVDVLVDADAVLYGGPDAAPHMRGTDALALLQKVRDAGVPIFVDLLKPGRPESLDELRGLLPLVDWFMPNDDQLRGLTGMDDLAEAASVILDLGVGALAVTRGAEGALVFRAGAPVVEVSAFRVEVVDTTGCGDAFNSGMITGLSIGCDVRDAALLGCACGSAVASGLGSDAGVVDLAGVLRTVGSADPAAADRIARSLSSAVGPQGLRRHYCAQ